MQKVGFAYLDRPRVREQIRLTQKAEKLGYCSVWACETRLARDAVSVLGALAAVTECIQVGSAVVNTWTRGPALMAMTFATLDNLAPGRMVVGLGAYWDPLAWKQGIDRVKPLTQMREYVHVVRRLLALEKSVTFEGEVVKVRDLRLDLGHGDPRIPPRVPIYLGATGQKMMELAGEIADGVLINGNMSVPYVREALQWIDAGARRVGRTRQDLVAPVLVGVAMDHNPAVAKEKARRKITMYLGQQPHVGKANKMDPEFVDRVKEVMGGWPPRPGGIEAAMKLVGDDIVDYLCAAGTPDECREKVQNWRDTGVDYVIISPITENYDEIIETFAP